MDLLEIYKRSSYKIFSPVIEKYLPFFESLKPDLIKGGIKLSLREYLSIAFATSVLIFFIEFPMLSLIFGFILGPIPGFNPLVAVILSLAISIAFSVGFFFFFYMFPSSQAARRKKNIDFSLPFAAIYLATTSGSRVPPVKMFKILSEFEEYGEISKEAKRITRDCDLFGMEVTDAMHRVAQRSPSEDFKEMLWGMITIIRTGGDLAEYLHERARAYMQDYRRRLDQYSNTLSTMIEIYITLIIVGGIFFIVMAAIMSVFGLVEAMRDILLLTQFGVIFLALPLISIGFIYMLKTISPKGA
jgi:flagellar protein FlaJ